MWMLSFVPDSLLQTAIYVILVTGIGAYFVSFLTNFIPPVKPYAGLIRIVGTVMMVAGVYFYGGYSTEMSWRNKVSELEQKVAESEKQSADANTKIQKVIVDRVKVVKEQQIQIQERIVEKEKIIDAECKVPQEAIDILNFASKRPEVKK